MLTRDRMLAMVTAAAMIVVAWAPIWGGSRPAPVILGLATLCAAFLVIAAFVPPRGSQTAFTMFWLTAGLTFWLGAITLFSLPGAYVVAGVLILLTITLVPNNTGLEFRWDRRYIGAFGLGLFVPWLLFLLPI